MAEEVEFMRNRQGAVRMKVLKYEGIIWPPMIKDPVKTVEEHKKFPYQDGDLFVCSYPRTGSNWMLDMLFMLRNNINELNSVMTIPVELAPGASNAKPSPRTLLTHMPYRLMPNEHVQTGGKMILMCRNPKDCIVSTFRFAQKNPNYPFEGEFEEFLQYFTAGESFFGGCIQYFLDWDKTLKENPTLPVLIVRYEDLKKDCVSQLRRVCTFLGIDRPDSFLQEVADKNDVNTFKAVKEKNPELSEFIKKTSTDGTLHFYRKGIVGDWKNYFTVAQNEKFDQFCKEQLRETVFLYD